MNRDVLQKIIRIIKLLRTHDNDQEAEKFEMVSALEAALAQPEFDTPESHIEKWSIPVDPNNFGEPLAQPEHPLDKKATNARELGLDYEPDHGFDRTASHMAGEYVDTTGTEHQFKYVAYGLRADENGKLSIGELPKREWVGLTEDEIETAAHNASSLSVEILTTTDKGICIKIGEDVEWHCSDKHGDYRNVNKFLLNFAKAVETFLKEKNGGV